MGKPEGPRLIDAYKPLYVADTRYFLLTGGRASLKSSTVHDFIARLTYESGHGVLFTRYTMTSAEKSIIPEFTNTLKRLGIDGDFKITKNVVTNKKTGSFIYFSGIKTHSGDQTANLKSIAGITTWVIEEGEDFTDEKTFDAIDDSIRGADKQNRVIWIQNPTTREHFIYDRWIKPKPEVVEIEGFNVTVSGLPEVTHIHSTYRYAEQLGYLDETWLAKARKHEKAAKTAEDRYRSWYYSNYIGGWLERKEGAIFTNWEYAEFDDGYPMAFGLDYGYWPHPAAGIQVAVDSKRRRMFLREHFYETKLNDQHILKRVKDMVGDTRRGLVVCDTSEPRTTAKIRRAGVSIEPAHKKQVVEDLRELTGEGKENDIDPWLLLVDPESENLVIELNNYIWLDKKKDTPIDDYNHLLDAMRYVWRRLTTKGRGLRLVN